MSDWETSRPESGEFGFRSAFDEVSLDFRLLEMLEGVGGRVSTCPEEQLVEEKDRKEVGERHVVSKDCDREASVLLLMGFPFRFGSKWDEADLRDWPKGGA